MRMNSQWLQDSKNITNFIFVVTETNRYYDVPEKPNHVCDN